VKKMDKDKVKQVLEKIRPQLQRRRGRWTSIYRGRWNS